MNEFMYILKPMIHRSLHYLVVRIDYEANHIKEILSQFHQHFLRAFFIRKSFWQLFSSYVLAKKALLYEKRTCKMLMKLTPCLKLVLNSSSVTLNIVMWSRNIIMNSSFKGLYLFYNIGLINFANCYGESLS